MLLKMLATVVALNVVISAGLATESATAPSGTSKLAASVNELVPVKPAEVLTQL